MDPDGRAEVFTAWIPKFCLRVPTVIAHVSRHSAPQAWSTTCKVSVTAWFSRQGTGKYPDVTPKQVMGSDAETDTFAMPLPWPSSHTPVVKLVSSSTFQPAHQGCAPTPRPRKALRRSSVKIVARSDGNSNLRARSLKVEVREKVKPALFAPASDVVVHVVTRRRLRQLKEPCQLNEPFNAGDRVQLHRRWGGPRIHV